MWKTATGFLTQSGFVCDDDIAAVVRATVLAVGVSLDKPADDPERQIAIINDQGRKIGNVPVYSKPSYEKPPVAGSPVRLMRPLRQAFFARVLACLDPQWADLILAVA
jgi:hypothetical protein